MPSSVTFSGWGSGTWARGGWNAPLIEVSVDGVSATASLGTAVANFGVGVTVTGV